MAVRDRWIPDWDMLLGDSADGPAALASDRADQSDRTDRSDLPGLSGGTGTRESGDIGAYPTEEGVLEVLKEVYDPELAIDIVNLGLVYAVETDGEKVNVRMTLTSPGCPMGPMIQEMVRAAITHSYPDVTDVTVEYVWSPPWDPYNMASEEAKDMLGIW